MLIAEDGVVVYPAPSPKPVPEEVPLEARQDLEEARKNLASGSYNSAVVMARRALQSACIEQGAPHGHTLAQQIAWLDQNRKITEDQRRWCDAARWIGNDGAHPNIRGVSLETAQEITDLVGYLFDTLYVAKRIADTHHRGHR
jgi:hypothetical protein